MTEQLIKTGIYRHFKKGDLYFVEKTFPFKQSGKEDVQSVYYWPLYEVSNGYARSIVEFNDNVVITSKNKSIVIEDDFPNIQVLGQGVSTKRFELIKELDLKFLWVLLPGNTIRRVGERYSFGSVHLSRFDDKEGKVFVRFSFAKSPISELELNDFLTKFVCF